MFEGLKIPGSFEALRTEGGTSVRNKKRALSEENKRRRLLTELNVASDGRLDTGSNPQGDTRFLERYEDGRLLWGVRYSTRSSWYLVYQSKGRSGCRAVTRSI